jgi:hypothetical protein
MNNDIILDHGYWPQSIDNEKRETLHVLIVDWYFSLYNAGGTTVTYRPSRCDLKKALTPTCLISLSRTLSVLFTVL